MTGPIVTALALWEHALSLEDRPEDAIALLADACAFGMAAGNFNPNAIIERLRESFDLLHVAKHMGVKQ